jgi:hypothetical protein
MKKFALAALVLSGLSMPALAQGATFEELDADGNGELSYEEVVVIWPQLTEADFAAADTDGSGGLSPDEVGAFQSGGGAAAPAAPAAPAPEPVPPADALPDLPPQ